MVLANPTNVHSKEGNAGFLIGSVHCVNSWCVAHTHPQSHFFAVGKNVAIPKLNP